MNQQMDSKKPPEPFLGCVELLHHKDVGIEEMGKNDSTWALRVSHPVYADRSVIVLGCQIRAVETFEAKPSHIGAYIETLARTDD